jgi:HSP20 family molecular chaperone IbpA
MEHKMKKLIFFLAIFAMTTAACSADNYETKAPANANTQQAQADYKSYVAQLKQLSQQYKQVSGQISEVLKETGVPSFDENSGEIKMVKYDPNTPQAEVVIKNQSAGIKETDSDMTVTLDLPGLDRKTISISIEQQTTLRVKGQRKNSETHEEIVRDISLPYPAKDKDAKAKYEDGVLTVTVPKAQISKSTVNVPLQ